MSTSKLIHVEEFVKGFSATFPDLKSINPWDITSDLAAIINRVIAQLDGEYSIKDGVAIHKSATIEGNVVLKPPVVISEGCFVGANAYFRGGVYLGAKSFVGPGCEIKSTFIFAQSHLAHFNFVGDSIIGTNVNFEAGSITANHYNERSVKNILVRYNSVKVDTGTEKFGAIVGDHSKIGANAVLSPGTLLMPGSIVKRLQLIDQLDTTDLR